ncbi:MAG: zinc ribbon domain-containing protein [Chloroflexi bacterium HGW-Chloroflexi-10]|nr:MAG: zinc ribbon domain-containing protein [Chloroflexi bacterium HGW-Chloroflexi-10]
MVDSLQFTRNYNDLGTERGFQFEFFCDRCGNGFRTPFKSFGLGAVDGVVDVANSLLGGILGRAADVSDRISSASRERAHDQAFMEAANQLRPEFMQCPRCSSWVCRKSCWNHKKGLCKGCAPDLGVEMSAAQASKSVEEVWAHAAMAEEDKKLATENWRETIRASCPECQAPLANNAKFCPECGAKLKVSLHCTECGAKLQPNAKFCGECGHKTE